MRSSTISTSNLALTVWLRVFGDEKLTTALLVRLVRQRTHPHEQRSVISTRHARQQPALAPQRAGGEALALTLAGIDFLKRIF